ncbi:MULTISPECIES: signal recognition particle-docking protein FtsY [Romboutsia]|uniref:signal recognition particle-docking protein FtsY n=1 Tax=Romboutsia TaxID=1501226 RepID=UPI0021733F77|nr:MULTISPECIES: signal recognition particle-docking protein FtsY [Romboutsia]MCI9061550.1 signal recognition particle-docking protein FtsY [Romboutsia sp.]MCI9258837.1 signal recognition particle-docking protein FtsY [Romboutsia sp.]
MFKKLFNFGKKKQEELNENEVVKEQEITVEGNDDTNESKQEDTVVSKEDAIEEGVEEKIENEEIKDLENSYVSEVIENINEKDTENENLHNKSEKTDEDHIVEDEIELNEEKVEDTLNDEKINETIKNSEESKIYDEEVTIYEDVKEENIEVEEEPQKKVNLFERLKQGLTKAKQGITDKIDDVLKSYTKVDEELLEELEEILITADVGVNTTMDIIDKLRDKIKDNKITEPVGVKEELKNIIEEILTNENSTLNVEKSPTIILMVGVNGVGKTTTIGKLANRYKQEGKKVLLAAGDTFRAAAIEQLEVWAGRSNVDIIKHQEGADPGAVVFDAIKAAKARKVDLLICDTAGRLHNKANLMNELGKVFKIVDREFPEANKEVLLVVDATTGQNAVVQAKTFKEVADITGIVLTKLDGTAKGGVVLAVKSEVDVPVKLIGVGEKVEDLQDFDAKAFSEALFGSN